MSSETRHYAKRELWAILAAGLLTFLWYSFNQVYYLLAAAYQLIDLLSKLFQ